MEMGRRIGRARGIKRNNDLRHNLARRRSCCFQNAVCTSGVENCKPIESIRIRKYGGWAIKPSPSLLYARVRQLPLCLRVRHFVSIVLVPVESTLVSPSPSSSSLSLEAPATGGKRKDSTWPPESPTARMGSFGCRAWVNSSEESGSVQRFSNIFAVKT